MVIDTDGLAESIANIAELRTTSPPALAMKQMHTKIQSVRV